MAAALVEAHGSTAVLRLTTDANAVDTAFLDHIMGLGYGAMLALAHRPRGHHHRPPPWRPASR